jgi:two-component system, OmpR family, alkaline phosphatase synthesis response regulator PhoP
MDAVTRILIVDDEPSVRFFLEETLSRDGHEVVAVASGEDALARIAEQEYDLALLDLKLSGIDGMDVLKAIAQQSPDTVTIVLTAHASLETSVEALREGAHDYLFKPTKTLELRESVRMGLLKRQQKLRQRKLITQLEQSLSRNLQEIRAAVEQKPAAAGNTLPGPGGTPTEEGSRFLRCNDLIVDLMRHLITLDGHLLELSPTEFNVLAYLVSEAPRVLSPQELVREVQGYESEPWEAGEIVRYHIYRIRQKIKAATGRTDVIQTVRGVGYAVAAKDAGET